jgi:hypothetical protein
MLQTHPSRFPAAIVGIGIALIVGCNGGSTASSPPCTDRQAFDRLQVAFLRDLTTAASDLPTLDSARIAADHRQAAQVLRSMADVVSKIRAARRG